MIQPKRYSLVASYYCSDAKMEAFEDGEFVRHADYAALQAENERLLKLGDAMYGDAVEDATGVWLNPAFEAWRTYKGVQP